MLSLSFVSCYFVVRKKSREMPPTLMMINGNGARRRSKRRRGARLLLDCALRGLVIGSLALFAVACFKWRAAPVLPDSVLARRHEGMLNFSGDNVIGYGVTEASVDITTAELYEEIKFDNQYGGAWTQGWNVQYRGDEWDHEKLKVIVVPHSHNDPGWLFTMEQYYQQQTRNILVNILKFLSKDHRRKFIWEEVSYLKRWWSDAWQWEKEDFIRLVKNGQLEIVGGGWVMNDEANSHYYAIIEQMTAGNQWLLDNVGVTPRNAWAIDPFGHSSTMAYLLKQMGFKNMVIQRTHYEVKKALALEKNLEFFWRQSWDSGNSTDILCHMMPFYFYDIPHTCGPEPGVCCQFDFWRLYGISDVLPCPWGTPPVVINSGNVRERAKTLLDQYRKKSTLYRTNTLLVPLGDDFRYVNINEAELQFENYQRLFDHINSDPSLKAEVRFGTLEDYFSTLREESSRETLRFPSLAGDFFTYADRVDDYWSGYYVTRPFYKAFDRVLEESLRAANIIFFFTRLRCNLTSGCEFMKEFANSITLATENLALFQHHDGVTGTAKSAVVSDYGFRMHDSLVRLQASMVESVRVLLKGKELVSELSRSEFNELPVKKTMNVTDDLMHQVTVFNSLASYVDQVITVLVDSPSVCVLDHKLRSIESQVTPEWGNEDGILFTGRHRLQWEAHLPALGFQTYFVVRWQVYDACSNKAFLSKLTVSNSQKGKSVCPPNYECTEQDSDDIEISNTHHTLGFDRHSGLLKWMKDHDVDKVTIIEEDLLFYSSRGSGAYLFHPTGGAQPLTLGGGLIIASQGPVMKEVHLIPISKLGGRPVTRSARLFGGRLAMSAVEMDYRVELLSSKFDNKEIVCRFKTGIDSKRVFYSDLNGFQTVRRKSYDKIPLQGNYYPMPSLAFLQGEDGQRFSVHSRQAVGVASLESGWLEMMLDRRLSQDDGRGLGQGIVDNRPLNVIFHLLLEKNVSELPSPSASAPRLPSLLSYAVGAKLNYQPLVFFGKAETIQDIKAESLAGSLLYKARVLQLRGDFPCDLHLVSLKTLRPSQVSIAPALDNGLTIFRRGWDASYGKNGCKTLDDHGLNLFKIFRDVAVQEMLVSSINFVHKEADKFGYIEQFHRKESVGSVQRSSGLADLQPMEIQAYKFSAVSSYRSVHHLRSSN